jgi:hypothetical protein
MSNPSSSKNFGPIFPAEWIAKREQSIERIGKLLAVRPMTVPEVAEACAMPRETARGHLMYMEGQDLAHRTRDKVGQRALWAAGETPAECCRTSAVRTVVNVHRHWMDVALFGPAQGACA